MAAPFAGRHPAGSLRSAFESLGPVWVKLGQALASTPALVPASTRRELRSLLDALPPFPSSQARSRARRALGSRLGAFDPEPCSAASVAQVHRAVVDGVPAAVKVLRPGIAEQVELDLAVLDRLAPVVERAVPGGRLTGLSEVIDDFAAHMRRELDPEAEADEMRAARSFLAAVGADDVVVPAPFGADTEVLAVEWFDGVPIDDRDALVAAGVEPAPVLQAMLLRLQEMALVRGRFHGDLHAGNVLVGADGRQAWLDWGIVGELDAEQALGAGRVFAGLLLGDPSLAVDGLEDFGVVPDDRAALIGQLDRSLSPLVSEGLRGSDLSTLLRRTLRIALARRVAIPRGMWLLAKQIAYFDTYARTLVPERRLLEDATEIYAYFVHTHPGVTDALGGGRVDEVLARLA